MPSLKITKGTQAGTYFDLAARPLSVGRDPSRDIQITDPKVSRKHAIIRRSDAGYMISLTKALSPVLLDGRAVESEAMLSDGVRLTIGDTDLVFHDASGSDHINAVHERKQAGPEARDAKTIM